MRIRTVTAVELDFVMSPCMMSSHGLHAPHHGWLASIYYKLSCVPRSCDQINEIASLSRNFKLCLGSLEKRR